MYFTATMSLQCGQFRRCVGRFGSARPSGLATNNSSSLVVRASSSTVLSDGTLRHRFSYKCVTWSSNGVENIWSQDDSTLNSPPAESNCVALRTTSTLAVTGSKPCKSNNRAPVPDDVLDGYVTELPSAQLPDLAREVAKVHPGGLPTIDSAPGVFGPPYVDDAPVTTTRPDGSTKTEARRWNLEYPGDGTVRFTPRVVETTPEGTTVTEGAPSATNGPTDCEKFPDNIGCSKYGTPEDGQVDKKTKNVSFSPVSLPGGGCPAPREFDAFGQHYSISWTPICDATTMYVKPVVLIICSAFAAFIFIGGLKS